MLENLRIKIGRIMWDRNRWFNIGDPTTYKYVWQSLFCKHIYSRDSSWYKPNKQSPDLGIWGESYCCNKCGKVIVLSLYYNFEKEDHNNEQ